jgi:hypothetical protein
MMSAPLKNNAAVPAIAIGGAIGVASGAARRVLNKHGKNK